MIRNDRTLILLSGHSIFLSDKILSDGIFIPRIPKDSTIFQ